MSESKKAIKKRVQFVFNYVNAMIIATKANIFLDYKFFNKLLKKKEIDNDRN